MKGNAKVIVQLQKLLAGELAAIDQYFIHSRMYQDWGLNELYERIKHETEEEMEHADALIQRMLFLETTPDMSEREGLNVGSNVPEMLKNDLELEYSVVGALKEAIAICGRQLFFFYAWQHAPDTQQLPGHGPTDFSPWVGALAKARYRGYLNVFMHGDLEPDVMSQALARSRRPSWTSV